MRGCGQMRRVAARAARASRRRYGARDPGGSRTALARASGGSAWRASTSLRTSDVSRGSRSCLAPCPRRRPSASRVNVLPSTEPSCRIRRSAGGEAVEACRDQCVKRLWDFQRGRSAPTGCVRDSVLDEQAAIEQHAHRLHGVQQRDSLGAVENLCRATRRAAPESETRRATPHRRPLQGLEVEGREVAVARPPSRPALMQLRAAEREHEQRTEARPLEEVFDEVEQTRVGPLHVLEHEHGRTRVGEPLEEQPPGREQILLVTHAARRSRGAAQGGARRIGARRRRARSPRRLPGASAALNPTARPR